MKITELYTLRDKLTTIINNYELQRQELFFQLTGKDEQEIIDDIKQRFEDLANKEY